MAISISEVVAKRKQKKAIPNAKSDPFAAFAGCKVEGVEGLIVEVIDTSDPSLITSELAATAKAKEGTGYCRSDIQITVQEKPSVLTSVVDDIVKTSKEYGKIRLLRFHGHGMPGYQTVWGGPLSVYVRKVFQAQKTANDEFAVLLKNQIQNPLDQSGIGKWNIGALTKILMRLDPLWAPNAEVWLMGCNVGDEADGQELITRLSLMMGVPVTAAKPMQFASPNPLKAAYNFLHEGDTRTGSPTLNPYKNATLNPFNKGR